MSSRAKVRVQRTEVEGRAISLRPVAAADGHVWVASLDYDSLHANLRSG